MVTNFRQHFSTRGTSTPQTMPIPGREDRMVKNNAGGYGFTLSDFDQLDRFLILGTEGGTYYVGESKLTKDNAQAVLRAIQADGERVVARIVEISDQGRAPKNDPALFALAMCAGLGNDRTRALALAALPKVARIGTHLFMFVEFVEGFRGWGRGLRKAIARWYQEKSADKLAYQVIKYRQRGGWSHRDLLRLTHAKTEAEDLRAVIDYVVHFGKTGEVSPSIPTIIVAAEQLKSLDIKDREQKSRAVGMIRDYDLPREVIPTEWLNDIEVWQALAERMPMTASIRNLGKMTNIGLIDNSGPFAKLFADRLRDEAQLKKARVHPIALLMALKIYAQGKGDKGSLSWTPSPKILDALDEAFYLAMANVVPTGKRILSALDTSGSMSGGYFGSRATGPLKPNEIGAAMLATLVHSEDDVHTVAFDTRLRHVPVSKRQRLDDIIRTYGNAGGGTDLSLPVQYAAQLFQHHKTVFDAIVIFTDSETWAGRGGHHQEMLEQYRRMVNHPTKVICLAATASNTSVVDPKDPLSLGVAGFDASVPTIIADFIRG